jgi:hypothetical protein
MTGEITLALFGDLEPGTYIERPVECWLLEARRAEKDADAVRSAAERALAALRARIAASLGPVDLDDAPWSDLREAAAVLEKGEEVKEAEAKMKELGPKRLR